MFHVWLQLYQGIKSEGFQRGLNGLNMLNIYIWVMHAERICDHDYTCQSTRLFLCIWIFHSVNLCDVWVYHSYCYASELAADEKHPQKHDSTTILLDSRDGAHKVMSSVGFGFPPTASCFALRPTSSLLVSSDLRTLLTFYTWLLSWDWFHVAFCDKNDFFACHFSIKPSFLVMSGLWISSEQLLPSDL